MLPGSFNSLPQREGGGRRACLRQGLASAQRCHDPGGEPPVSE
jgi:hypothetical protein